MKKIMGTYTLKLQAPWEEVKERMKENNIALTDEDLVYEPGQEETLLARLEKKMKRSQQQIKDLIESISANESRAS
ncbi:MAG TPA: hypothetical protein VKC90_11890 [Chitinophagaceae bacterium]|nr:hypothetical protein [Chitinophagaceae bacterium]